MNRFSGLKLNIAGTLILLLATSLLLGCFVTMMFWRGNLVRGEVQRAKDLTVYMGTMVKERLADGKTIDTRVLGDIAEPFKEGIMLVGLFDGQSVIDFPSGASGDSIRQRLRNVRALKSEDIKIDGKLDLLSTFLFDSSYILVTKPVVGKQFKKHSICVQVSLKSVYQALIHDLKVVLVYLLVNIIIFSVIGWFRLVRFVVQPIERMVSISESYNISAGISFRSEGSGSEFGRLSMALNSMLLKIEMDREALRQSVLSLEQVNQELIDTQREMILTEKLASVGRLAAGLAHEIGNPLGIIQGYVELLKRQDLSEEDKLKYGDNALSELERIKTLIGQLLDFSRTSRVTREIIPITPLLKELQEMLLIQNKNVEFELTSTLENDELLGDRDGLRQVFLNCLLNGLDAIDACGDDRQGFISVAVSQKANSNNDHIMVIRIADNGIGVRTEGTLEYFEPFYTTKEPGQGTGLGLSVSHTIIETHEGIIHLEGREGGGAVVTIELPKRTGETDAGEK